MRPKVRCQAKREHLKWFDVFHLSQDQILARTRFLFCLSYFVADHSMRVLHSSYWTGLRYIIGPDCNVPQSRPVHAYVRSLLNPKTPQDGCGRSGRWRGRWGGGRTPAPSAPPSRRGPARYTCAYVNIHIYEYIHIYTFILRCTYKYIYTYMDKYTYIYIYTQLHMCICTHI